MEKPKLVQGAAQENKNTTEAKKIETPRAELKGKTAMSEVQEVTQREAVFTEVMRIVREEKIVVPAKQPLKPLLNETHIKKICAALVAGFQGKKIALKGTEANKKKLTDTKLMELYCLGLLNNWLRRDKRLNGVGTEK